MLDKVVRTVLSAAALGITDLEHRALIRIRNEIRAGKIVHDPVEDIPDFDDGDVRQGLNMNIVLNEGECGTTACIGGWAFKFMSEETGQNPGPLNTSAFLWATKHRSKALGPLFNPLTDVEGNWMVTRADGQQVDFPYEVIDTDCVVLAIENFLATGHPDYESILEVAHS